VIEFLVRRAFISAITLLLISLIVFTGVRMIWTCSNPDPFALPLPFALAGLA
jgi:hypothetical protein